MSIQKVRIEFSCPACGAEGYEFELDSDELGSEISAPCDECPKRIAIDVSITLQSLDGEQ